MENNKLISLIDGARDTQYYKNKVKGKTGKEIELIEYGVHIIDEIIRDSLLNEAIELKQLKLKEDEN